MLARVATLVWGSTFLLLLLLLLSVNNVRLLHQRLWWPEIREAQSIGWRAFCGQAMDSTLR